MFEPILGFSAESFKITVIAKKKNNAKIFLLSFSTLLFFVYTILMAKFNKD